MNPGNPILYYRVTHLLAMLSCVDSEIDRSVFLPLLQDQMLLQNQKQKLLPDTEAPVHAEAPVKTRAPVVTDTNHSYIGLQKL